MSSVRDRTIARIKTLAAAGVVVGCGGAGYGVVDPMPSPACFENPQPVVTAKILETTADGSRMVEVIVKFQQTDAKFQELGAYDDHIGTKLDITEQTINANDFRAVIKVPKPQSDVAFNAVVKCTGGSGFSTVLRVEETTVTARIRR